jgi:hypothetical protein
VKNLYTCGFCGQEHEEWPALTFSSPTAYDELTDEEKKEIGQLSSDFCVITHPDQTDRFIRCTLTQKVTDHCENLDYGVWVSLSEKSYQDYYDNYDNDNHLTEYFGWLCISIPEYDNTLSIPTNVKTRSGNSRPEVIPHQDFDHPFVTDYYNGITKNEAESRIKSMLIKTGQFND